MSVVWEYGHDTGLGVIIQTHEVEERGQKCPQLSFYPDALDESYCVVPILLLEPAIAGILSKG